MASQRYRRTKNLIVKPDIALVERVNSPGCRRCDPVKDSKQRVAVAGAVPGDKFAIIEVVASVQLHAAWEAFAKTDFAFLIQERNFDPVYFRLMFVDDLQADFS